MRRFLAHVASFVAINGALLAALDAFYMRQFGARHFLAAWREKADRLAVLDAPRLLLVGGSSTAFGLDSERLERATGRSVVNLALNAGLGLRYILEQAADAMRPGDLVILTPEYYLLWRGESFDAPTLFVALRVSPENLRHVPGSLVPRLLDQGLVPVTDRLRALAGHLRGEGENPAYTRASFNRYGDAVAHHSLGARLDAGARSYVPTPAEAEASCRVLASFAGRARAAGASLVVVVPPIPADDYDSQRASVAALWRRVGEATGAEVLLVRKAFPRDQFFDSVYHLTKEGRGERTRALLAALRRTSTGATPTD